MCRLVFFGRKPKAAPLLASAASQRRRCQEAAADGSDGSPRRFLPLNEGAAAKRGSGSKLVHPGWVILGSVAGGYSGSVDGDFVGRPLMPDCGVSSLRRQAGRRTGRRQGDHETQLLWHGRLAGRLRQEGESSVLALSG